GRASSNSSTTWKACFIGTPMHRASVSISTMRQPRYSISIVGPLHGQDVLVQVDALVGVLGGVVLCRALHLLGVLGRDQRGAVVLQSEEPAGLSRHGCTPSSAAAQGRPGPRTGCDRRRWRCSSPSGCSRRPW